MMKKKTHQKRCAWCGDDPLYVEYHDKEWGKPLFDDQKLFEFIILEGAQAGLSWITILRKRENYRKAFDQFSAEKIARYDAKKLASLLQDAGIVRNRLKIQAVVVNAQAYLKVVKEFGSFSKYLWSFVGGKPIVNRIKSLKDLPSKTEISDKLSLDLKARGFKFVGSTIVYAHMQAVGMVNDHEVTCFRYKEV